MWVFRLALGTHPSCRPAFERFIHFRGVNCCAHLWGCVVWYKMQTDQSAYIPFQLNFFTWLSTVKLVHKNKPAYPQQLLGPTPTVDGNGLILPFPCPLLLIFIAFLCGIRFRTRLLMGSTSSFFIRLEL